jgi:prepilin-type N-terminal cleavage/methylation domain-containing protein
MKILLPRFRRGAAKGFTLIELLTVIAIIAILMGLLFPAFSMVREKARQTQAKNDVSNIITAVKAYYTEYGKYPLVSSGTDTYFGGDVAPANSSGYTGTTVASGTTNVSALNPRQIVFMEIPAVKNTSSPAQGVVPNGSTGAGSFYDPWGSQYNIIIDGNYDNTLTNPYSDTSPPGGTPLNTGVIAYAYGKNGNLGGGAASKAGFSSESGSAKQYKNSGDIISWQ